MCEKERNWIRKQVLSSLAHFGEAISDQCQLKLQENQDVNLITDAAVLEINESGKIRELCRAIGEIPETAKKKELKEKREVAKDWAELGEIREVNSADKIGQLEALRFKMNSGNSNLPSSKSEEILENGVPGLRQEIQKEEMFKKYGDSARQVEIGATEKHVTFRRIPFS